MHGNLYLHLWTCTWLYRSDAGCLVSVAPGGSYAEWAEWSGFSRGWRRAGVSCFHPRNLIKPSDQPASVPPLQQQQQLLWRPARQCALSQVQSVFLCFRFTHKQHVNQQNINFRLWSLHVNEMVFSCVSCPCGPDLWLNVWLFFPHDLCLY